MKLFYDEYSSRMKGEVLLLLADMAALSSAVLFATGVVHRGSRPDDVALLVVWACIPRALAKVAGQMGRPSQGWRLVAGSGALLVLTVVLLFSGWEIISGSAPRRSPIEPSTVAVVFFAWGSGFLLFHARAYRLHDFLLWSVVLLGLKDARPQALAWIPVFFLSALLSAAVRHLLHDAFRDARRARLNLQNAKVSAFLAATAAVLVFLGVYVVIHGGLDFPTPRSGFADDRAARKLSADFIEGNDGRSSRQRRASAALQALKEAAAKKDTRPDRIVGFTYRVALRDLSLARFDPREVLRAKAGGEGHETWRPHPAMRWKAVSFSRFNAADESWSEETDYVRVKWPPDHKLARRLPALLPAPTPVTLEMRVVMPVCRNIVMPYFTSSIVSRELDLYRESALGDIFPYPTPSRGTRYSVEWLPARPDFMPQVAARGAHEDARHLELPAPADVGIDLRSYANAIFTDRSESVQAKLQRLQAHFAKEFRYSQNAVWKAGHSPLATFLLKEKTGNCTYFATAAALLVRAAGVSSRVAVGFLGGEWDEKTGEAVIRNRTAHAWIEAFFPGDGWYPIDATAWVAVDPSFQPPQDVLDAMSDVLRAARNQARDGASADVPSRAPRLPPSTGEDDADATPDPGPLDDSREVTDELPEGTQQDSEDGGSWIEYAGEIDAEKKHGEDPAANNGPDGGAVPEGIPGLGESPWTSSGDPASAAEGLADEPAADDAGTSAESARIHAMLRFAPAAAGAVVVLLLVLRLLRKPTTAEDDEEEEGDPDASAKAALFAASALARLDETDPGGRVIAEYLRLQQTLERTRSHRRPHQTPLEHARAVARRRSDAEKAFFDLHRVLYRLLYGGEAIDAGQAEVAVRSCRRLRKILG